MHSSESKWDTSSADHMTIRMSDVVPKSNLSSFIGEVFFNIETYNSQSQPRNTEHSEQEETGGNESDFSINDILWYH
jgi:hypothetical protein